MRGLELDIDKYIGFGTDKITTMISKNNGVAIKMKEDINYFSHQCIVWLIKQTY